MKLTAGRVISIGFSMVLTCVAQVAVAEPFQVELTHPQSDDQGHYVGFAQVTNATVFGTVAPAEKVKAMSVNDQTAQLLPGELVPFGAPAGAQCLEFRATVELGPNTKLSLIIHDTEGQTARVTLEPSTSAVTARLRDLVQENPNSARERCRLGGALRDQGKTEEAIAELRESLKDNMSCVSTRVMLGMALVKVGRPEEAVKEFALATESSPDYAMAWLNLGLVHARFTRNTAEAVRCFKRYLELEPESSIADKVRRYVASHP